MIDAWHSLVLISFTRIWSVYSGVERPWKGRMLRWPAGSPPLRSPNSRVGGDHSAITADDTHWRGRSLSGGTSRTHAQPIGGRVRAALNPHYSLPARHARMPDTRGWCRRPHGWTAGLAMHCVNGFTHAFWFDPPLAWVGGSGGIRYFFAAQHFRNLS